MPVIHHRRRLLLGSSRFQLASVPGAYSLYDFNNLATLFQDTGATTPVTTIGDPCRRANDVFGSGRNLTAPSDAARPTLQIYSGLLNGLQLDGTDDYLLAATAADWRFISDGTGASIFLQFRVTDVSPEIRYVLAATSDDSTTHVGISILYRDDGANEDRAEINWFRGVASTTAVGGFSANNTLPAATNLVLAIRLGNDGTTRSIIASANGEEILHVTGTSTLNIVNPTRALSLGSTGIGGNYLKGTFCRAFFCTGITAYDQYRTKILAALSGVML